MDDFTICCHIAVVSMLIIVTFVFGMAVGSNFDRCNVGKAKIVQRDVDTASVQCAKRNGYEIVRIE